MKTPFDDAVAVLVNLANEGFSRGWDRLDRADKHDEIAKAIGGVHAEWFVLVEARDRLTAERDRLAAECHGRRFDLNLVREVERLKDELDTTRAVIYAEQRQLDRARAAAQVYAARVDALGLAADDNDPLVIATAEPIGAAQADLFAALGLLVRDAAGKVSTVDPAETVEQLRAERDTARTLAEVRARDIPGQIAAWLNEYDPTLDECRAALSSIANEPVTLLRDRPGSDRASHVDISFDNAALVIITAIRAGQWRARICPSTECQIRKTCTGHANCTGEHPRAQGVPVNLATMRTLALAARDGLHADAVAHAASAHPQAVLALLDVVEAAVEWTEARCSRMPECDPYDGRHDAECLMTLAEQRTRNAIDNLTRSGT